MKQKTPEEGRIPHQLDVYFPDFCSIDCEKLEEFLNSCDGDEQDCCEVSEVTHEESGPIRLRSYLITLGAFNMALMVHEAPSPATAVIREARLPEEMRQELLSHRCFALLTVLGGEDYPPFEAEIFLWKTAIGLCLQGATGAGHPWTGLCYPAPFLQDLDNSSRSAEAEGEMGIWQSLREDGVPRQLLADIRSTRIGAEQWLFTRGFAQCGFDDLLYRLNGPDDVDEAVELFDNLFAYQMLNGPVLEAGHTFGYDERVAYRFSEPPSGLELPFPHFGLLLISRENAGADASP